MLSLCLRGKFAYNPEAIYSCPSFLERLRNLIPLYHSILIIILACSLGSQIDQNSEQDSQKEACNWTIKCPSKTFTKRDRPSNLDSSLCAGLFPSPESYCNVRLTVSCICVYTHTHMYMCMYIYIHIYTQTMTGDFILEGFHIDIRKNFLYIWSPILDTMHSWKLYHKADHHKGKLWLCLLLSFNKHLVKAHYVPGTMMISVPLTWSWKWCMHQIR